MENPVMKSILVLRTYFSLDSYFDLSIDHLSFYSVDQKFLTVEEKEFKILTIPL